MCEAGCSVCTPFVCRKETEATRSLTTSTDDLGPPPIHKRIKLNRPGAPLGSEVRTRPRGEQYCIHSCPLQPCALDNHVDVTVVE